MKCAHINLRFTTNGNFLDCEACGQCWSSVKWNADAQALEPVLLNQPELKAQKRVYAELFLNNPRNRK